MNQSFIPEQAPAVAFDAWPLWRLGFRPFYLLASIAIVILVPLWLVVFTGHAEIHSGLSPANWHGHEMVFGVVTAVIVGFLFTAGKTWTGRPTPRGGQLFFLALLWLVTRIAGVLGPADLFAWLDIAFLPLCVVLFLDVLTKSDNQRNYIVAGILGLIALANLAFHVANWGIASFPAAQALKAGVGGLVLMETLIAGRVLPFFTRNVNPGLDNMVPAWREKVLAATSVAAIGSWLTDASAMLAVPACLAAAGLHGWRLLTWRPQAAKGRPILWSLYLAYVWIPLGFGLLALARWRSGTDSGALHAFTVGATGGLLIAMMTRTARGHTARQLQAGQAEKRAYLLVAAAALSRVAAPYFAPAVYEPALFASGAAFASAFAIYAWVYVPWLTAPRLDGKDG
ncbi:MAG: NnrS family protein [Burkholderiaceae bacterium]|nr:NnrS family protein [Burkholderiaceae bacterium]